MSNTSETDVANAALDYCGGGTISTIDDTESKPARTLKRLLPQVRRECIAKRNWSFARRTIDLTARAAHDDYPLGEDEFAFPLPAEMCRFDELVSPSPLTTAWRIEGGPQGEELIIASEDIPTVRVMLDIVTPSRWSPLFIKLVAAELGKRANPQLEGDKGGRDRATADAREALRQATSANLQTTAAKPHTGTPFTLSRRRGGASAINAGDHPV